MDPRIDEILRITKDTNRIVHKMRRSILWGRFFLVSWWVIIIAVSGVTYYVYAQPYVNRLEQLYMQVEQGGQKAQTMGTEVSSFFGNWLPHAATATTTTQ